MKFITDSRTLLSSLPPLTGNAARLGHRLSQAIDLIEQERKINAALLTALIPLANLDYYVSIHSLPAYCAPGLVKIRDAARKAIAEAGSQG